MNNPPFSSLNSWPVQPNPYRREIRHTASTIGFGLLLLQAITIVSSYGLYGLFSLLGAQSLDAELRWLIDESTDMVSYILAFWLATLFILYRTKVPVHTAFPLRLPRVSLCIPAVGIALGVSVIGAMLSGLLSTLIYSISGKTPVMPDMPLPEGLAANIVYVFYIVAAAAIFEELLFRGVILQSLRRFGDGFALVISSLLFSLLHGNLVQGPNTLVMGLVIGYFVLRTGSVWTGILIHLTNNGLSVLFSYIAESMNETQLQTLNSSMMLGYTLAGLTGLAFLLFRGEPLLPTMVAGTPEQSGRKYNAFFSSIAMLVFVGFQILMMVMYIE